MLVEISLERKRTNTYLYFRQNFSNKNLFYFQSSQADNIIIRYMNLQISINVSSTLPHSCNWH